MPNTSFHGSRGTPSSTTIQEQAAGQGRKVSYRFYPHFHPYVDELVKRLLDKSVAGLEAADTEYKTVPAGEPKPEDYTFYKVFFEEGYKPNHELVDSRHPVKDLDFSPSGAYAVYNWELFFHVPFTIAVHLSKNQRFEEAQQWFHYVFDPTDDSDGPTPERFWRVKPFQITDVKMIEDILVNLASGDNHTLRDETISSLQKWKDAPFRPHAIARFRQSAYMFKTVMAYLDNLIAWGDMLFRQDTGESINEAMQLYVLAANILGPRPQAVPKKGSVRPQTYASLKKDLDKFGNALEELEADIPFDITPQPTQGNDDSRHSTLKSIGKALYFRVPRNDKLLAYWDTVADRLFKIRNSLNLQGIFRQLPVFEPPIDPAMLAKAAAAGLEVGAILSGVNQPLPLVRFQLLAQKAAEICQEVKALGNNLLSAIEKEDNEALAILRAKHERVILELAETVRYGQWQEAIKNREGLEKSLNNAAQRYKYYEQLLGITETGTKIPTLDALDTDSLGKMKFKMDEPQIGRDRRFNVNFAETTSGLGLLALEARQGFGGFDPEHGGKKLNRWEAEEMDKLKVARNQQIKIEFEEHLGAVFAPLPDSSMSFSIGLIGFGFTGMGGTMLSKQMSALASFHRSGASKFTYEAGNAAKIGAYDRRELEWTLQGNLAAGEITQTFKQLRAAQIREAIAEREWKNHQQQIRHAEDIELFLSGEKNSSGHEKTSTQAFYTWMKREVKGLYGQCFQFAFDVAKKAERALQHELGNPDLSFLQFGYLAGKEGLLAGEKLYLDIKRMEMAYHDLNQREYELTRHVSLLQVNPMALLQLRATGRCSVSLPEELFDMDGPGHYFRRIKTVALSIPCVAGPYTSVNCTLTLLKSRIRKSALVGDGYARQDAEDPRFSDHFGSMQSIVTSTGQNDSGLFETNLRDERYLPFENSGVVSEWQLELPANPSKKDPRQFDYDTISDVILHIRYTAREGGGLLRNGAVANIKTRIDEAQAVGSVRLFSVRQEFPTEWAKFQGQTPRDNQRFKLALTLRPEHYPFWSQGRLDNVERVDILARSTQEPVPANLAVFGTADKTDATAKTDTLVKDPTMGNLLVGQFTDGTTGMALPAKPVTALNLFFNDRTVADLWIAVTWSGQS
jgi:hypothetical protein